MNINNNHTRFNFQISMALNSQPPAKKRTKALLPALPSHPSPSYFILEVSKSSCFLCYPSSHTKAAHSLPASEASVTRLLSQGKGIVPQGHSATLGF